MKNGKIMIQPITFLFLLWMIVSDRTRIGLFTLAAAVLHECGHLTAAKAMKIPLRNLRMDLLGARLDVSGRVLSYGEEWLLCAAGPATSLLGAAFGALFWHATTYAFLFSAASFLLGLLNLLPIRSFDGGRMLETTLLNFCSVQTVFRVMRGCSFLFLFLIWAIAVYFLLLANDGLSLLCFSMSLFSKFFEGEDFVAFDCSGFTRKRQKFF